MNSYMRGTLALAMLALCVTLAGCAQMFTSKTNVTVEVLPDKTCRASYSSDKEQVGLTASVCGGFVSVEKSGTLESVVASSLALQLKVVDLIQTLTAQAKTAAPTPIK
jgi:hypothetical protein